VATEESEEQGPSWTFQTEVVACNLEQEQVVEDEEQRQAVVQYGQEGVPGEQVPEVHHWPEGH